MNSLPKKEILGVGITSAKEEEILEYIFASIKNRQEKYYIVTPNPEIVTYAQAYPAYKRILNKAKIALCDGVGIMLASKLMGNPIEERVTGVDLLECICKKASREDSKEAKNAVTVGFLGAGKGVALKASERLEERYPGLQVVFIAEEWNDEACKIQDVRFKNNLINHKSKIINQIDILFVAFGFPKQEEWMAEHLHKLPVKVMIGVGGAFDYLSGKVPRAPKAIRSIGLEWLYRLIRQPWRIKRQLVLPKFLFLVFKEKFT